MPTSSIYYWDEMPNITSPSLPLLSNTPVEGFPDELKSTQRLIRLAETDHFKLGIVEDTDRNFANLYYWISDDIDSDRVIEGVPFAIDAIADAAESYPDILTTSVCLRLMACLLRATK